MPEGWSLTMGRDLYGLNRIFLKHEDGMLQYWDPLVCLVPYPEPVVSKEDPQIVGQDDIPAVSPQVVGAVPKGSGPGKTIKMQFKQWDQRSAELQSEPAPILMRRPAFVEQAHSLKEHMLFADHVRMMCLLCFRQFKTRTDLDKHTELSELHKTNLASYNQLAEASNDYRNRAEERRQVGPDTPSGPVKRQSSSEKPIGSENVGSKLLKKMGWKEGEGLGADSAGIKEPIKASGRGKRSSTGIGADKR